MTPLGMSLRILVLLAILGEAFPLSAQVEQATILGTVTDSSGDVVPGASVSVLNSGPGNDGPHGPTIAAITRLRR